MAVVALAVLLGDLLGSTASAPAAVPAPPPGVAAPPQAVDAPQAVAPEPVVASPTAAAPKAARKPAGTGEAARPDREQQRARQLVPKARSGEKEIAPPLSIAIPRLGISQTLIGLRVSRDGTLGVPADYMDIGWWSTGPAPGEPGGAVVVGHVTWNNRPAVFARLARLERGAAIVVERSDGSVVTYRVAARRQFAKSNFPDDLVYTFNGPSSLHLVTCGGYFDRATRRYADNIVVFADLVSDTRTAL